MFTQSNVSIQLFRNELQRNTTILVLRIYAHFTAARSSSGGLFAKIFCRRRKQNLHPWVKVDQAVRPLPPKTFSILVGLALKLISLCNHNKVRNVWMVWFVLIRVLSYSPEKVF